MAFSLGYEDDEGAPGDEMLAAAARIARAVDVSVTVDAEAGYGMDSAGLVAALNNMGAAGCKLEDTDHAAGALRDPGERAKWLAEVRDAASAVDYPGVARRIMRSSGSDGELTSRRRAWGYGSSPPSDTPLKQRGRRRVVFDDGSFDLVEFHRYRTGAAA